MSYKIDGKDIFPCRAWAYFSINSNLSVRILGSGNISSIALINSNTAIQINFTNAMPSGDYAIVALSTGQVVGNVTQNTHVRLVNTAATNAVIAPGVGGNTSSVISVAADTYYTIAVIC